MSGNHLSKEFFELVKAIGECRSKQEEDKIMQSEITCIKQRLSEPPTSAKKSKEVLVRLLYVELLGHDASLGYIHAVNLTNDKHLLAKRTGYLACSIFLNPNHELMLLLINTMLKDLNSANYLEVSSALIAASHLINSEMVPVMLPIINRLLQHSQEGVRKKALLAYQRCLAIAPGQIPDPQRVIRKALSDPDSSVMGVALHLLAEQPVAACKDLVPSLVSILKQVIEHRLPKDYEYHRMPAPWLQLRLINLLGHLCEGDAGASEFVYDVLQEVMRRADTGVNAGHAIVFECVKCAARLYRNHTLLEQSALMVAKFLAGESHNNLKCLGVTGLAAVVAVSPQYAAEHQLAVVECLEDSDETLKRETLHLLVRMTNPANAVPIVSKLLLHLRTCPPDAFFKRELAAQAALLAEQFAPTPEWYIDTVTEVFILAGSEIPSQAAWTAAKVVLETDSLRGYAVKCFSKLLTSGQHLAEAATQASAWVLGEWGGSAELTVLKDFVFPGLKGDAAASVLLAVAKIQNRLGVKDDWFLPLATKMDASVQRRAAWLSLGDLEISKWKQCDVSSTISLFESFAARAKPPTPEASHITLKEPSLRFTAYEAPPAPVVAAPAAPAPPTVAVRWGPKGYSKSEPVVQPAMHATQSPVEAPPKPVAPVSSPEQLEKRRKADELFMGVAPVREVTPVREVFSDDLLEMGVVASVTHSRPDEIVDDLGFLLDGKDSVQTVSVEQQFNQPLPTHVIAKQQEVPRAVTLELVPILITTTDVGEAWPLMTSEETVKLGMSVIDNFEDCVSRLAGKIGAFVVEIIGQEAILAGKNSREEQVFLHCSIRPGSETIDVMVVSASASASAKIASVVKSF